MATATSLLPRARIATVALVVDREEADPETPVAHLTLRNSLPLRRRSKMIDSRVVHKNERKQNDDASFFLCHC